MKPFLILETGRPLDPLRRHGSFGHWIRVAAGKARDRFGNPLTIKLTGPVEAYLRDAPSSEESPA